MTSVDEALAAIRNGATAGSLEGQRLEFKADVGRSRNDTLSLVAKSAACLANASGGTIVLGVADKVPGQAALVGTALGPDEVRRAIHEQTEPNLVVGCTTRQEGLATLLVVEVLPGMSVHAVGGRSEERVGSSCMPMSPDRIAVLVAERRGDDWSNLDSAVPLAQADPVALAQARTLLERLPDPTRRAHARRSDPELLRVLGLVTESGTLNNAGAALFTATRSGDALAYTYRRTPTGSLVATERLSGPLLTALTRALDLVDARLERTSVNVGRGQQLQVADLPEAAIREAVVNAVMHRDYRRGGPVSVEHSATRLAIDSPGPFLSGITPDNILTTASRSRNPQLAAAIRMLGLAEQAGSGVDRMYAEMARIGHQPPSYVATTEHVQVVLTGGMPNAYVTRFTATLPAEEAEDADTMLILLTLLTRRNIDADGAAPLLQRPVAEAQGVLGRLAADPVAILEPTRETARRAHPKYRLRGTVLAALGPAVAYHRRVPDDVDRKIIGLVAESGSINGRTVRLVLDLDTVGASRVLADLVERGVLAKTSKAQRGPSVTYGPGPRFPKKLGRSGHRSPDE